MCQFSDNKKPYSQHIFGQRISRAQKEYISEQLSSLRHRRLQPKGTKMSQDKFFLFHENQTIDNKKRQDNEYTFIAAIYFDFVSKSVSNRNNLVLFGLQ